MKKKCIFCLIIDKEVEADLIIEDDRSIAFFDRNPLSKGHSLIVTKKHYDNLLGIEQEDWNALFFTFKVLSKKLKKEYSPKGFNLISNIGKEAFQSIMHLHIHLIPKYQKKEGFVWPDDNY